MQVREYGSPGLLGMYGDEHDDGYSRKGNSYWGAVYQVRVEFASMNRMSLGSGMILMITALEGKMKSIYCMISFSYLSLLLARLLQPLYSRRLFQRQFPHPPPQRQR